MSNWQPIETAPKPVNGASVLLWVPASDYDAQGVIEGFWFINPSFPLERGQWMTCAGACDPSHWMPLHAPPLSSGE